MAYRVSTYMDESFPSIDINSTIGDVARKVAECGKEFALVLENGLPKGLISNIDIVSAFAKARDAAEVRVADAMSPLVTMDPDGDLMEASGIMASRNMGCVAVAKGGIVYGLLTARGIATRCPEYVDHAVKDILRWSLPGRP